METREAMEAVDESWMKRGGREASQSCVIAERVDEASSENLLASEPPSVTLRSKTVLKGRRQGQAKQGCPWSDVFSRLKECRSTA